MLAWQWQFDRYFASLKNPAHQEYAREYSTWKTMRRYGAPPTTPAPLTTLDPYIARHIRERVDKLHGE